MKSTTVSALIGIAALAALGGLAYHWQESRSPAAVSRELVKSKLNDPESAVFRNHVRGKRGGEGIWCGEVNARNRMGGMVGFTRYVANVEPDRTMDFRDEVHLDEGNDSFAGKWRLMCDGV
jgi:hypothetical protein